MKSNASKKPEFKTSLKIGRKGTVLNIFEIQPEEENIEDLEAFLKCMEYSLTV
ncbi:MAG: hypothetical protein RBS56_04770 [Candidatus Gracilibacteria bacterium]|jgi:hypothetical protein|nr:hypothetical protein [Candidatus Gracilibacteria bacterium]